MINFKMLKTLIYSMVLLSLSENNFDRRPKTFVQILSSTFFLRFKYELQDTFRFFRTIRYT